MKLVKFITGTMLLLAGLIAGPAYAQHTMLPDLVGTWESATGGMQLVDGPKFSLERDAPGAKAIGEIVISDQDGEMFTGTYRWAHVEPGSADGNVPITEEKIAGVLDFDGTYVAVEKPDSGIHRFRLIDENNLEVILFKSGPDAVVMRGIYKRRQ